MTAFEIRQYRDADEQGWVRCRALSFLGSAFFDDQRQDKERYARPAVELVADSGGEIVGLIDVECEEEAGTVCEARPGLGGMIWYLAVHPDHQRRGIATALLREAAARARARGIERLEAWTRDDAHVQTWYESRRFERIYTYQHVYVELDEGLREIWPVSADGLRPVRVFAHYVGDSPESVKARFRRVHDDVLFELSLVRALE